MVTEHIEPVRKCFPTRSQRSNKSFCPFIRNKFLIYRLTWQRCMQWFGDGLQICAGAHALLKLDSLPNWLHVEYIAVLPELCSNLSRARSLFDAEIVSIFRGMVLSICFCILSSTVVRFFIKRKVWRLNYSALPNIKSFLLCQLHELSMKSARQ